MMSSPGLSIRIVTLAIAVCTLSVTLAACSKAPEASAGKAAGAQVLPGTISDAMPNLDRSQAQPLLQAAPAAISAAVDPGADAASNSAADPVDQSAPADPAKPEKPAN
ncbi:hypothetical protein [Novosphingobium sp.]|uniref:hypothetical protein n=1 Tax=Novosphingobium sp. TaxID=1874826 RepID=UPI003341AB50